MRIWTSVVTALLVLGLSGVAPAKTKKHDAIKGTVESVAPDGKSFVLKKKGKKAGTVTETLADSTKVLVKTARHAKAQPGAATDLKAGKHVRVSPATGTPKRVVVREFAKAGKHGAKGKGHKKAKAAV